MRAHWLAPLIRSTRPASLLGAALSGVWLGAGLDAGRQHLGFWGYTAAISHGRGVGQAATEQLKERRINVTLVRRGEFGTHTPSNSCIIPSP